MRELVQYSGDVLEQMMWATGFGIPCLPLNATGLSLTFPVKDPLLKTMK